jgi:hypothetical protein
MNGDRFLEETLPASPAPSVTESLAHEVCCLCDQELGRGQFVQQRFETDPTDTAYRAHARCAHEYAIAIQAFRSAAAGVTPET